MQRKPKKNTTRWLPVKYDYNKVTCKLHANKRSVYRKQTMRFMPVIAGFASFKRKNTPEHIKIVR